MSVVKGSSEDFFRSLTSGARFNKSKYDVKMFSNDGKKPHEKQVIKTMSTRTDGKKAHHKKNKKHAEEEEKQERASASEYEEEEDFIEEGEDEPEPEPEHKITLFGGSTEPDAAASKEKTDKKMSSATAAAAAAESKESKKQKKKEEKKIAANKKKKSVTSILLTHMNLAPGYQAQLEAIERVHKENGIKVSGNDVVAPIKHFSDLKERLPGIDSRVLRNLRRYSIEEPSPIQMQAIPSMALGREVIGVAPTGSGKTLAYVLPLIYMLTRGSKEGKKEDSAAAAAAAEVTSPEEGKRGYRSIILSPTRELAQQIYRVFKRYCDGVRLRVCLLTRGVADKKATLPKGAFDVLVATPMRLVNMIKDGSVDLRAVQTLVLDEADRLFDDQFVAQVDEVAAACKDAREGSDSGRYLQVCLFSATMLPQVEQLAASIMRDPVRILVGHRNVPLRSIRQSLVFVGNEEGKLLKMVSMVREGAVRVPCLVFVQSKERGTELRRLLLANGVKNVRDINADKSEAERERIVNDFRVGKIWFLISTEIMARGMDFPGICSVINYDFPQSNASYVHRVGRTGRGTSVDGVAFTFFTESDAGFLRTIANSVKAAGCEVPDWMLALKPLEKSERKRLEKHAPKRRNVGGVVAKKEKPYGAFSRPMKYSKLSDSEKSLVVVGKRARKSSGGAVPPHSPPKKKKVVERNTYSDGEDSGSYMSSDNE